MRGLSLALVAAFYGIASAARLAVSIPSSPLLANPAVLPASTHAVLLGSLGVRHDVPIRRDNSFIFPLLTEGSYLLTIHERDYFFPPLRIDVSTDATANAAGGGGQSEKVEAWQTFRGNEWDNKGQHYGSSNTGDLRIEVRPTAPKDFYQQRGGFNILGFLKSPMILMALFSLVMVVGLPYMMENMDPETKKEFEEMQSKSPLTGSQGTASSIQNFDLAGWMAGKGSSAETGESGSSKKR